MRLPQEEEVVQKLRDPKLPSQEEVLKLSTYGARRTSPTLAQEIRLRWEDRLAAGGWADAGAKAQTNLMPHRYSGGRKGSEAHAKVYLSLVWQTIHDTLTPPVLWINVKK